MVTVATSVFAAFLAQFISLPFLMGRCSNGERLGWTLIAGIFLAIPSIFIYAILFSTLYAVRAPAWLIVLVSVIVPALVPVLFVIIRTGKLKESWLLFFSARKIKDNWLLFISTIGGLTGGLVLAIGLA